MRNKTLKEIIAIADELNPNSYSNEIKAQWVNEVEAYIQTEIYNLAPTEVTPYIPYSDCEDHELSLDAVNDKIYLTYLQAMIDFSNKEYQAFNNDIALYNTYLDTYAKWYVRTHGEGEALISGMYLSAYGIAVKHGFSGSEEEWLTSLKGDKGDTGKDGRSVTNVTSSVAGDTVYLTIWYDDYTSEETSFLLPEPGKGINSVRYYETYENGDVELSIEYTDGTYQIVTIPGLKAEKTYEWEHIGTITVEADENGSLPQSIIFSEDSEGNPLALDAFYINAIAGATDGNSARVTVEVGTDTKTAIGVIGNMDLNLQASLRKFYVQFVKHKEWQYAEADAMSSVAATSIYPSGNIASTRRQVTPPYSYENLNTIKKVTLKLNVGTEKTWIAGSTFELYGVRK